MCSEGRGKNRSPGSWLHAVARSYRKWQYSAQPYCCPQGTTAGSFSDWNCAHWLVFRPSFKGSSHLDSFKALQEPHQEEKSIFRESFPPEMNMTGDSPMWQRGTVFPSHGQPQHPEKWAEQTQDKRCHHCWNAMVTGRYRMVYRSSPHAARLFQLCMKDQTKVCLKETLKMMSGSGRYCRNDICWQKSPSTIQKAVRESCSSDLSSLQRPGDWIITFIGHGLDPVWQIWCY